MRWWGVDPKANEQPWQSTYSYMDGNAIRKNDPQGDFGLWGAVIGGGLEFTNQVITNKMSGKTLTESIKQVDWYDVGIATVAGAVTGGLGSGYKIMAKIAIGAGVSIAEGYIKAKTGDKTTKYDLQDATFDGVLGGVSAGVGEKLKQFAQGKSSPIKTALRRVNNKINNRISNGKKVSDATLDKAKTLSKKFDKVGDGFIENSVVGVSSTISKEIIKTTINSVTNTSSLNSVSTGNSPTSSTPSDNTKTQIHMDKKN